QVDCRSRRFPHGETGSQATRSIYGRPEMDFKNSGCGADKSTSVRPRLLLILLRHTAHRFMVSIGSRLVGGRNCCSRFALIAIPGHSSKRRGIVGLWAVAESDPTQSPP